MSDNKQDSKNDVKSAKKQLALGWDKLKVGQVHSGKIVRIEKFGAFVDIGVERPGLVHISEITTGRLDHPDEVVNLDEEVEVEILDINKKKRQIKLSMKTLEQKYMSSDEENDSTPTAMELALRAAMGTGSQNKKEARAKQKKKTRAAQDDILKRTLENKPKE